MHRLSPKHTQNAHLRTPRTLYTHAPTHSFANALARTVVCVRRGAARRQPLILFLCSSAVVLLRGLVLLPPHPSPPSPLFPSLAFISARNLDGSTTRVVKRAPSTLGVVSMARRRPTVARCHYLYQLFCSSNSSSSSRPTVLSSRRHPHVQNLPTTPSVHARRSCRSQPKT